MNTVILIGRLTKDPELRFTGTGKAVATFTVAVNRGFGKDSEADFIPVVVWEKQAENCANYLAKGREVGIQGRMQTRSYETQNGEKRYVTEVVANTVEFIGGGGGKAGGDYQQSYQQQPSRPQPPQRNTQQQSDGGFNPDDIDLTEFETMEDDDDLPF